MEEIWKDIKGYENLYQVSNLGNVRRLSSIITDVSQYGIRKRLFKGRLIILNGVHLNIIQIMVIEIKR